MGARSLVVRGVAPLCKRGRVRTVEPYFGEAEAVGKDGKGKIASGNDDRLGGASLIPLARGMGALFEGVDVLLTPVPAAPAPTLGAFPTDTDDVDGHVARTLTFSPYTALFNVTGQPAIVLPLMADPAGLSLGIQFAARHGADGLLLKLAAQIEQCASGVAARLT